jgi:long-chain acyl-CoA synthetase
VADLLTSGVRANEAGPVTPLLGQLAEARGTAPAVVDERRSVSWVDLDGRVARLVHALRARGLASGDRVVALLGNQVELVEVSLACAQAGWVLVPLNWHSVSREVAYVVDDAGAVAVVVDQRWASVMASALEDASAAVPVRLAVGDARVAEFEPYEEVLAAAPDGDLLEAEKGGPMFYTSGTTGNPKGVRSALTAVGGPPELFLLMAHSIGPSIAVPPLDPGDATAGARVQLICGPMYHSAQWVFGVFSLLCGATVVLQHKFDAEQLLTLIDEHAVTNVHLVPTQMVRLLDLPPDRREAFDGSSLRSVIHGAAPCAPAVKRAMIDWLGPIVTEYYGGTEGGFLAMISADEWLRRPGSVGRPMPLIEVCIVGADGARLPPNHVGEIWFRNTMGSDFEYHNAAEKTAAAHRPDGFGTLGDVGYLDDDGYLYLSDRKIDMVVSGGVNIYPAEVEGVLTAHPAVSDVAVFGIPNDEMGEAVHAVLVLRGGHAWSGELERDLDAWCREELAGYKRPRSYEVRDSLPRNEAGKLTKRALRDPWWADHDRAI